MDAAASADDPTSQTLGVGGLVGGLVALFLGYLLGGYAAGRMARFDGAKNGIGVVIWTVVMALVLGGLGTLLGDEFAVPQRLRLDIEPEALTAAGAISLAIALVVMLGAAVLGGKLGAGYHRKIDRASGVS